MRPLNDREWLEQIRVDMLGRSLADYDHATSLLDTLDQCEPYLRGDQVLAEETLDAVLEHVLDVPTLKGRPGANERVEWLACAMDDVQLAVDAPDWESVTPYVQELVDLRADLLVLLVEAGVAHPNVMPDDPISILRMFLPDEGD